MWGQRDYSNACWYQTVRVYMCSAGVYIAKDPTPTSHVIFIVFQDVSIRHGWRQRKANTVTQKPFYTFWVVFHDRILSVLIQKYRSYCWVLNDLPWQKLYFLNSIKFLNICMWDRARKRAFLCWFTSPNAHQGQSWAISKLEARNSIKVTQRGGRNLIICSSTAASQGRQ